MCYTFSFISNQRKHTHTPKIYSFISILLRLLGSVTLDCGYLWLSNNCLQYDCMTCIRGGIGLYQPSCVMLTAQRTQTHHGLGTPSNVSNCIWFLCENRGQKWINCENINYGVFDFSLDSNWILIHTILFKRKSQSKPAAPFSLFELQSPVRDYCF